MYLCIKKNKSTEIASNLSSLKSQAKIQFGAPLTELDANSKLKITLGSTEHIFSIGGMITGVTSYVQIADFLNKGGLKSDTINFHSPIWDCLPVVIRTA